MNEVEAARGNKEQGAVQGHQLSPFYRWRKRLKIPSSSFFSPCHPSLPSLAASGNEGVRRERVR